MLNTGEVCCCRFSADVKSKYYSKNNVLNILQYKSNNIKQELHWRQRFSTFLRPKIQRCNYNFSAFWQLFCIMSNRFKLPSFRIYFLCTFLQKTLRSGCTNCDPDFVLLPTPVAGIHTFNCGWVESLADISQRHYWLIREFCCTKTLLLNVDGDEAQLLLVVRHWLTTSSSEEFSRAAATLSLSASCLLTAHTQYQRKKQLHNIQSQHHNIIPTASACSFLPASSVAWVPGVIWTSIWVETIKKHKDRIWTAKH